MLRKRLALTALAVALAFSIQSIGQAGSTMKLATATINDVQHQWQKMFAEELEARIGDAVKTEIYPASQLGAIPRMSEGVLLGTIEAFTTPTSFMTNVDPRFQAFDVPGLFKTPDDVDRVIYDPQYRHHLEEMFLNKGLRVIGAMYNSPTVVFTKAPVTNLEDLKGLKIRTFASPLQIKPMELLDVTPLPLALSEVIPQLQSGGLDGMLVGVPILTAFKYYDVGKNILDLRFAEIISVTVMNEAWYQQQNEDVKAAIIAAGRAAEEKVFPWGVENVQKTYEIWTDNQGVVTALSVEEQARMEAEFSKLATDLLALQPEVQAEYEKLQALVEKKARP